MKRIHYLLLGLAVSLCIAAVSPTTPPTRIIAGSGVTVVTNGVNNFTLSASGGVMNQNQFDSSSTNIKSGALFTNIQVTKVSIGGTSSSFPMITNLAADLYVRLADGSGDANVLAKGGTFTGGSGLNAGRYVLTSASGAMVESSYPGPYAGLSLGSSSMVGWTSGNWQNAADTVLYRSAAGQLELNTGTVGIANRATLLAATLKGRAGTSSSTFNSGGALALDTTQTGNVGAGEDTLQTYSVPANALAVNGDILEFRLAGTFATSANNKRLRVKYGGTTIYDSTALAIVSSSAWVVTGRIIRTGAATQKCELTLNTSSSVLSSAAAYTTAAETLSGAVTFLVTGEATTDNDVVKETFSLKFLPAP